MEVQLDFEFIQLDFEFIQLDVKFIKLDISVLKGIAIVAIITQWVRKNVQINYSS